MSVCCIGCCTHSLCITTHLINTTFVCRYHELFRLLFTPSPALSERVTKTMKSLDLIPSEYSSVHLRVKYPHGGVKEEDFTFEKHKSKIVGWANNAVNCAAELHPNSTIYVSSDNNDTVGYLLEDSPFAKHYIDATEHKKHPLLLKLVSRDYSCENEHVAFSSNKPALHRADRHSRACTHEPDAPAGTTAASMRSGHTPAWLKVKQQRPSHDPRPTGRSPDRAALTADRGGGQPGDGGNGHQRLRAFGL